MLWEARGLEIVSIISAYERGRALPARYGRFGYWIVRSLLAIFGGLMAAAQGAQTDIIAVQLGITDPRHHHGLSPEPAATRRAANNRGSAPTGAAHAE